VLLTYRIAENKVIQIAVWLMAKSPKPCVCPIVVTPNFDNNLSPSGSIEAERVETAQKYSGIESKFQEGGNVSKGQLPLQS
jgi:hypothetical protein